MPRLSFVDDQVVTAEQINDLQSQAIRWYENEAARDRAYGIQPPVLGECSMLGTKPEVIDYWDGNQWLPNTGIETTFSPDFRMPPMVPPMPTVKGHGGLVERGSYEYKSLEASSWNLQISGATIARAGDQTIEGAERTEVGPSSGYDTQAEALAAQSTARAQFESAGQVVVSAPQPMPRGGGDFPQEEQTDNGGLFASEALANADLARARGELPAGAMVDEDDTEAYQVSSDTPAGEPSTVTSQQHSPPGTYSSLAAARAALQAYVDGLSSDLSVVSSDTPRTAAVPGAETPTGLQGPLASEQAALAAQTAAVNALPAGHVVVSQPAPISEPDEWGAWSTDDGGSQAAPLSTRQAAVNALAVARGNLPAGSEVSEAETGIRTNEAVYGNEGTDMGPNTYGTEADADAARQSAIARLEAQGKRILSSRTWRTARARFAPATSAMQGGYRTPAAVNLALQNALSAIPAGSDIIASQIGPSAQSVEYVAFYGTAQGQRNTGVQTSLGASLDAAEADADDIQVPSGGVFEAWRSWMNSRRYPTLTQWEAYFYGTTSTSSTGIAEIAFIRVTTSLYDDQFPQVYGVAIDNDDRAASGVTGQPGVTRAGTLTSHRGNNIAGRLSQRSSGLVPPIPAGPLSISAAVRSALVAAGVSTTRLAIIVMHAVVPTAYRYRIDYSELLSPETWNYEIEHDEVTTAASYWWTLRHRPLVTAGGWFWELTSRATTTAAFWTWTATTQSNLVPGQWSWRLVYTPANVVVAPRYFWELRVRTDTTVSLDPISTNGAAFFCAHPTGDPNNPVELLLGMLLSQNTAAVFTFNPYVSAFRAILRYRGNVTMTPARGQGTRPREGFHQAVCPAPGVLWYQVGESISARRRFFNEARLQLPTTSAVLPVTNNPQIDIPPGLTVDAFTQVGSAYSSLSPDGGLICMYGPAVPPFDVVASPGRAFIGNLASVRVGRWGQQHGQPDGIFAMFALGDGIGETGVARGGAVTVRPRRIGVLFYTGELVVATQPDRPVMASSTFDTRVVSEGVGWGVPEAAARQDNGAPAAVRGRALIGAASDGRRIWVAIRNGGGAELRYYANKVAA